MTTGESLRIDVDLVARTAIFGGLPEAILSRILGVARVARVATGATVFEEGQPARSMFVVCEGELEVYKRRSDGSEVRLALLHRGDSVGEMSLIEIQPRSATARALSPTALYVLEQVEIARLYQSDLEVYTLLVLNIAREISRRLRLADQRLLAMGFPGPSVPILDEVLTLEPAPGSDTNQHAHGTTDWYIPLGLAIRRDANKECSCSRLG